MRDLLNLIDNLTEARGLSARVPGETFNRVGGDTADDMITFSDMTFYPPIGSYNSSQLNDLIRCA